LPAVPVPLRPDANNFEVIAGLDREVQHLLQELSRHRIDVSRDVFLGLKGHVDAAGPFLSRIGTALS